MQATPSNHGRQLVLRRLVTFGMAAGVFAALVGCPNSARADFDKTLALKVAPDLLKYLRDNGYHSVGVLKFRVKRGNEPESFYVGPLNDTLVTRLENALVYKCDEGDSFQLLQNPSAEAAQQKQKLSYLNPAGRAKLLELEYPLAFGDEKARVKPDVFLTGLVEIRPLEHRATLTIEAFSQKSKDLTKVGSFEVPLDRAILVDAGMPFAIPKTLAPSDNTASDATANAKKPAEESLLAITVLYGGEPQSIVRKGPAGEFSVPEPAEKQRVAIKLKNKSNERLGVVLLVNGQSTLFKQRGLPTAAYKKWMIDPGVELEFTGFHGNGDDLDPFVVRTDAESKLLMEQEELSSCNLGSFEVFVFRESSGVAADSDEPPFSLGMRAKPTQRAKSLIEAHQNFRAAFVNPKALNIIEGDEANKTKETVTRVPGFKNPQLVTTTFIRYYHPKMKEYSD